MLTNHLFLVQILVGLSLAGLILTSSFACVLLVSLIEKCCFVHVCLVLQSFVDHCFKQGGNLKLLLEQALSQPVIPVTYLCDVSLLVPRRKQLVNDVRLLSWGTFRVTTCRLASSGN
jgi:hypothetical protein